MAAFNFSLQQVLNYREQLKEQAQVAFARAQAELRHEEEKAESLKKSLAEEEEHLLSVNLDHGERWLLENYVKGLRTDLNETLLRVRSLTEVVDARRQELAIRAKEHKILEKLKARQMERYLRDMRMQEQKNYDETAAIRFKAPSVQTL